MNIKKFLNKKSELNKGETIEMFDYPINFTDPNGFITSGYLQDVIEIKYENTYTLKCSILSKDKTEIFLLTKTCKAPDNTIIDWDTLSCPTNIL